MDGDLIMSPRENTANSFAAGELHAFFRVPAREAGFRAYPAVNVKFSDKTWIEPDLVVAAKAFHHETWVDAADLIMPVEFVSPSSRRKDRVDKPARCAAAGIPYFMRVEVDYDDVLIELLQLRGGDYRSHALGKSGEVFEMDLPFPLSFDPASLLEY
ncbi:Uma2 family endonuclease [Actinokineospora soli]|uniref:Uma2 family endonuclease n=1 Tax=Actinokineospora soli TaxID=1048753 RepID=A0ABW2TX80_9PSEU